MVVISDFQLQVQSVALPFKKKKKELQHALRILPGSGPYVWTP